MKILHVHTLPIVSGSGINTLLTMQGSTELGHRVALACESEGRLTDEARKCGIQVFIVPSLQRELHLVNDIAAVFALKRLMRSEGFEIVHTHNSKAGFVGRLAARLARIPVVVHTIHGFAFHDAESPIRRFLFRTLERIAAQCCDGMIFISKPLQEWAHAERIGRNVPWRLIYSGIDVEAFRKADPLKVRNELGIQTGRLVAGMVSKLWEGKGHHILFQAWQRIQQHWKANDPPLLLIVGEGPLGGRLRELAIELGIADTVLFTGFRTDIPEITAAIDVAVLASAFEGMGRVILEAKAAGKPVIASKVGGIPDLVDDGMDGLLVKPNDPEALADALEHLLKSEERRQALGRAAASSLQDKYSSQAMVEEIHDFYDFLVKTK